MSKDKGLRVKGLAQQNASSPQPRVLGEYERRCDYKHDFEVLNGKMDDIMHL